MVCEPQVFNYIQNKDTIILEQEPLQNLAKDGTLNVFRHESFWQPMDTLRKRLSLMNYGKRKRHPGKHGNKIFLIYRKHNTMELNMFKLSLKIKDLEYYLVNQLNQFFLTID